MFVGGLSEYTRPNDRCCRRKMSFSRAWWLQTSKLDRLSIQTAFHLEHTSFCTRRKRKQPETIDLSEPPNSGNQSDDDESNTAERLLLLKENNRNGDTRITVQLDHVIAPHCAPRKPHKELTESNHSFNASSVIARAAQL